MHRFAPVTFPAAGTARLCAHFFGRLAQLLELGFGLLSAGRFNVYIYVFGHIPDIRYLILDSRYWIPAFAGMALCRIP
jgi:hypothetical protein